MATVLLVQADAELGSNWGAGLTARGHQVVHAGDTADGIARALHGGIDIIVVDSPTAGPALEAFVAQIDRLADPPPFVLVSSSPRAPMVSAHLGAASFLPKPCSLRELGNEVDRLAPFRVAGTRDDLPVVTVPDADDLDPPSAG